MTVSAHPLRRGRGVLPLPSGAFEIERLTVVRLERNRLGAVKVDEGLGLVTYTACGPPPLGTDADHQPRATSCCPSSTGRSSPRGARSWACGMPAGGRGGGARARVLPQRTSAHSLYRTRPDSDVSALDDFLNRSRAGHCEYFATATVLLLRAAGIPARYATGYSVQEVESAGAHVG